MSSSELENSQTETADGASPEKAKLSLELKIDKPSACERHITVTIARDDIERYFDDAISEMMPKAAVPGFRLGRAPRKLVESRFRKEVGEQVKGALVMDSIQQVTEEAELSAISEPDFKYEAVELPNEGPMTFEFDIEVRPEFNLPVWKALKLERPSGDFSPADVDSHLKRMLKRHAQLIEKDGPAKEGDFVTVDVTFKKGDEVVSEISDETIGVQPVLSFADARLEGFDKLIAGAAAGETREGKLKISADAANEALRGEELTASFKVNEVQELELPELDSTLLERLGGFENEGDLRDAIKEHLQRQLSYHQGQRIRQQIADLLTESANWDLPANLLKRQSQRELQRAVLELRSAGFSDQEILAHENELRQNSQASTAKALKEHFILERIAEDEKIEDAPEDYEREITLIALQSGDNPRRVRARLEKQGLMDTLRNQIIERKVIDVIKGHAEFKDVPYQPQSDEVEAIDHFVAGEPDAEIPAATHEEAQPLRQPADHT